MPRACREVHPVGLGRLDLDLSFTLHSSRGLTDTPLTRNPTRYRAAVEQYEHTDSAPANPPVEQVARDVSRQNPMKVTWLQPRDIAPIAVFLAWTRRTSSPARHTT
jgi:hypothetical protein